MKRHPTEQKILDEAVRVIDVHGEAAVRLQEIQEACDVSAPSIYHYFGSREGLVIEAQSERLLGALDQFDPLIDERFAAVTSKDELRTVLRSFLELFWQPERTPVRLQRLSALGSAIGRPGLTARFEKEIRDYSESMTIRLEVFRDRGWIVGDLDLRAFSYWMMGVILGRVYIEFGGDPGPYPEWDAITGKAVEYVLFGPE
jgi:AcrR family transcriptional regulator